MIVCPPISDSIRATPRVLTKSTQRPGASSCCPLQFQLVETDMFLLVVNRSVCTHSQVGHNHILDIQNQIIFIDAANHCQAATQHLIYRVLCELVIQLQSKLTYLHASLMPANMLCSVLAVQQPHAAITSLKTWSASIQVTVLCSCLIKKNENCSRETCLAGTTVESNMSLHLIFVWIELNARGVHGSYAVRNKRADN